MLTTRAARIPITISRLYSTVPPTTPAPNIHSVQSRPRTESIRTVKEAAGDTNRAILDAIAKTEAFAAEGFLSAPSPLGAKKTVFASKPAREEFSRDQRTGGGGAGKNGNSERRGNSKQTSLLGRQLVERRNANGGVRDEAAKDITPVSRRPERTDRSARMGASSSSSSSPRFSSSPRDRSSPSSSSSSRSPNKSSPKPRSSTKQARQPAREQLPMNVYSPAPLDLAALIKEDLASRSAFLRAPTTTTDKSVTPAEAQKERLAIKAENLGDYSRFWLAEGKTSSVGKGAETVGRARRMLTGNPSLKLEQREAFLDIVGKALQGKRA